MKKVLLALEKTTFSEGAFKYAVALNEHQPILLTGIFLPHADYANLWSYSGGGMSGPFFIPVMDEVDEDAVAKNISAFETNCIKHGIEYRIHKDFSDLALPELIKESRFADLLLVSSESFYETNEPGELNEYLQDALHSVECPVLVVPEKFDFPSTNVLAYDGSESAVFALKQFAYLFPELTKNETLLVYAAKDSTHSLPEQPYIEELAGRHFPNLTITKIAINPKRYFSTWLADKKNTILVSGSFGRSGLSRLFYKSFSMDVIKGHKTPVFIAHYS